MEGSFGKIERLESLSLNEFLRFAKTVGETLRGGEVILLSGELGSGKTTFVRGMAEGLGIDPRVVRSPTFTIMNVYPGRVVLYHVDLYRLNDPSQLFYIGLEEVLEEGEGIVAVEWADLFKDYWDGGIWIHISINDDGTRDLLIEDEEGMLNGAIERWKEESGQVRQKR